MASSYPGGLDALTNPTGSDSMASVSHASQHANANDAIEAIQTELGTDPAGASATVAARFDTKVTKAASSTNNALARFDGTGGDVVQNSGLIVDDSNNVSGMGTLGVGAVTSSGAVQAAAASGFVVGSGGPKILGGTGSPEGVVTAPVGSTYIDTAATTGAIKWIKATGTGNTGWVVEYGDTGWRDVSASLDATFLTANPNATLFARRTGDTVRLSYKAGASPTFTTNYATVYAIPSGFRPGVAYETPLMMLTAAAAPGAAFKAAYFDGNSLKSGNTWASGTQYWGDVTYTTTDTWPSSLPGSAA